MHNDFYRALEDVFRGGNSLIKKRLEVYLPFIKPLQARYPEAYIIDLGCGRGEWLDLLRDQGIDAIGVDLDESMLEVSRALNLNVHCKDAVEFLRGLPEASVSVITGFHIVEHLEFQVLQELFQEALRVLRPFGLIILETPNAENLYVGACSFYLDPTHKRPLPIDLLGFLPAHYGYDRVKVLRLQEDPEVKEGNGSISNILLGVSPDYAIVAQKGGIGVSPDLSVALDKEYGVSLQELSARFDRRIENLTQGLDTSREELRQLICSFAESEARFHNLTRNIRIVAALGAAVSMSILVAFVFLNL